MGLVVCFAHMCRCGSTGQELDGWILQESSHRTLGSKDLKNTKNTMFLKFSDLAINVTNKDFWYKVESYTDILADMHRSSFVFLSH